jgi:ATP-dependent helicase HrpB
MLVASGGDVAVARACAILSERHMLPPRTAATSSDLLSALDSWDSMPAHVQRAAEDIRRTVEAIRSRSTVRREPTVDSEKGFRYAVFAGFADRVGQRRSTSSPRVLMASGAGAVLGRESGVVEGEFIVALDLHAGRPGDPEAHIRIASLVDREWLVPTAADVVHSFDRQNGIVRATEVDRYGALILAECPIAPDRAVAARVLAEAWLARGPDAADARLLRRARFAGCDLDVRAIVEASAAGAGALADISIAAAISRDERLRIDRDAPELLRLPSGRGIRLDYGDDGSVSASIKLQELFGVTETPKIGPRGEPVLLSLLAPNGRPVQLTRDLRSFWQRTYPEVRKELRGRYPKHKWPEDPKAEV